MRDDTDLQLKDAWSKELDKQESVLWLQADIESLTDENWKLTQNLRIAKSDINALNKINDELTH